MTRVLRGRNEEGELIYDPSDPSTLLTILQDFFATPLGKRFVDGGFFTEYNMTLVDSVIPKLYSADVEITQSVIADAIKTLMDAGELVAYEPEDHELTEDQRRERREKEIARMKAAGIPLDKNNRPLSPAQISWGEMTRWTDSAIPGQIQKRRLEDKAYASFYTKKLETDAAATVPPIDLNARPATPQAASPALLAWVDEYHRTPVARVKALLRGSSNPNGYIEYGKNFRDANAAGLI
jgi:hypothetical protein